jgi:hypothetical protein
VHIFVTPTGAGVEITAATEAHAALCCLLEPPIASLSIGQNRHIRQHVTGNELVRRLRRLGAERCVEVRLD